MAGWAGGWPGGWVALEEWKLRLTSAKVEGEVEAELGNRQWNESIEEAMSRGTSHSLTYFFYSGQGRKYFLFKGLPKV